MVLNLRYLIKPLGIFKLSTIILGLITFIIAAHAHLYTRDDVAKGARVYFTRYEAPKELTLVIGSICCVATSAASLFLIAFCIKTDSKQKFPSILDVILHTLGGIIFLTGGIFFVISAREIHFDLCEASFDPQMVKADCPGRFLHDEKIAAGALGILNGLLYGVISCGILTDIVKF